METNLHFIALQHVYDGSAGEGDYYLITMEADMNFNGGAAQGYGFKEEFSKEKADSTVKKKNGIGIEAKVAASWGWNWAEKVQRSVGDISIKNTASKGNEQAHEIIYQNLPKSDKTKGWIEQQGNNSYKATTKLKSAWGWYKKNERDDSENKALVLHMKGRIDYQWWYHDGAWVFNIGNIDEYKAHGHAWVNSYFQLDPIYRKRVGQIYLVNDLPNTYIKNIKVYPTDDPAPEKVVTFARTYPAKEKINLGCRLITGKYTIEFDARRLA